MEINKFIETYKEDEYINIDFIVSIYKDYNGYYVSMADGKKYEINDYDKAEKLFEYLKNKKLEI